MRSTQDIKDAKFDARCAVWRAKWDTVETLPGFSFQKDADAKKVLTLLADYACFNGSTIMSGLSRFFTHPRRNYALAVQAVIVNYFAPENERYSPESTSSSIQPWFNNSSDSVTQILSALKIQLGNKEIKDDGDLKALLLIINEKLKINFDKIETPKAHYSL